MRDQSDGAGVIAWMFIMVLACFAGIIVWTMSRDVVLVFAFAVVVIGYGGWRIWKSGG